MKNRSDKHKKKVRRLENVPHDEREIGSINTSTMKTAFWYHKSNVIEISASPQIYVRRLVSYMTASLIT